MRSPPTFPELLTASACALPIFEITHDALDSFAERKPAVVFVGDLHAQKHGASNAAKVREPFINPRRSVVSDYR